MLSVVICKILLFRLLRHDLHVIRNPGTGLVLSSECDSYKVMLCELSLTLTGILGDKKAENPYCLI